MTEATKHWQETPVALGWLVASIVLMVVLENSFSIVSALQPLTTTVLSDARIFSGWNRSAPFDSEAAKTLTAIFLLLVPVQVASLFSVPDESICPKAQAKGIAAFATIVAVAALVQPLVFAWGLSINGPLKIFGKESSWGAAATIWLVTFSFSYLVRMIPILLAMCGLRTRNKLD